MERDKKGQLGRRQFFRTLGGGTAVAAASLISPVSTNEAQAYDPGSEETKARYRESNHVKAFYRTNGYESLKK